MANPIPFVVPGCLHVGMTPLPFCGDAVQAPPADSNMSRTLFAYPGHRRAARFRCQSTVVLDRYRQESFRILCPSAPVDGCHVSTQEQLSTAQGCRSTQARKAASPPSSHVEEQRHQSTQSAVREKPM